jgi:dihydropteroate synthase
MDYFKNLNCPILTGISRKSMVYKVLKSTAQEALNGTTALNMTALMSGSKILRVHDVKEALECVKLYNALTKTS